MARRAGPIRRLVAAARGRWRARRNRSWRVLRRLGVSRQFQDWARYKRLTMPEVWRQCPRPDWLLRLAAEAGVSRGQVEEAARDSLELLHTPGRSRAETLAFAVSAALERWRANQCSTTEMCDTFRDLILHHIDRQHELATGRRVTDTALQRVQSAHVFHRHISDRKRGVDFLQGLARAVRRAIPLEALTAALEPGLKKAAPYR